MAPSGLSKTAAAYLKRSTPCGGIRIQKQRHLCAAQHNASVQAERLLRTDSFATMAPKGAGRRSGFASARNASACAPAEASARASVAICIFGTLARFDDARGAHYTNLWLTQMVVRASLDDRVIGANPGWEFDLFVHSWQVDLAPFIERTFQPRRSEYGLRADGRSGMFLSIERVLELRREVEQKRGAAYDWVLLTRPDVVWMRDFAIRRLNPSLFYVANWCVTTPVAPRLAVPPGGSCRPLELFAPETHQLEGVPDYYFLAAAAMADRVFDGITTDLARGAFSPTARSCCNHAIVAGRLQQLGLWARLGRALYHHMDLENLRVPKYDMDRYFCHLELARWGAGGVSGGSGGGSGGGKGGGAARNAAKGGGAQSHGTTCVREATGGHWEADAGGDALAALMDSSLRVASPTSRCPVSLNFCMCRDAWARYPQLSQEVATKGGSSGGGGGGAGKKGHAAAAARQMRLG